MLMNGEGKKITFVLDYLGAIKQAPILIKHIQEDMPKLNIDIDIQGDCFGYAEKPISREIFYEDAKKNNVNFDKIKLYSSFIPFNDGDLEVELVVKPNSTKPSNIENYKINDKQKLNLAIDPIKFAYRKLVTGEEKERLKNIYGNKYLDTIVAGSVNSMEMDLIIDVAKEVVRKGGNKKFFIVPRTEDYNLEKFLLNSGDVKIAKRGEWLREREPGIEFYTEPGKLDDFYSIADSAIIGDSFHKKGCGQNPLEPAFYGVRSLCGNNWHNNCIAYNGLMETGLLKVIPGNVELNKEEVKNKLVYELLNPPSEKEIEIYKAKTKKFIEENQQEVKKYVNAIKEIIYRK
ncbi:MAG: hypothetical protein AB7V77_02870 [Candidatus Woesearchaeota archaeon]